MALNIMNFFKKIIMPAVVVSFCLLCLCACSSGNEEETTETETASYVADFYKLYDENKTLSVELEADPASGYNWTYEITDESILNLTSFMFNPGDENGEGALWTATFAASSAKGGAVQLSLYSVQNLDEVEEAEPVYVMDIDVTVDGKLTVKSIKQ